MPRPLIHTLFALAMAGALWLSVMRIHDVPEPAFATAEYVLPATPPRAPRFEQGFIFPAGRIPEVHSGTLTELGDDHLLAAWFGGSREGAADVAIHAARWSPEQAWEPPYVLLDRAGAQRELGLALRKLGNPVLYRSPAGKTWLFFVAASIGGWSTSFIGYKTSLDDGQHWSVARRLVTSPFLNISTLVRARPLGYADAGIGLPVYHELAGKFGELLRLSADGTILSKTRMGSGRSAIQPSLVASSPLEARAYLRRVGDSPRRILLSESNDGGGSWSTPRPTALPNPDASVAAVATPSGRVLLAYNHTEWGRGRLSLARETHDGHWQLIADLESGGLEDEFSYPYLIRTHGGDYHLIYTWQRTRMAHVRFNDAWLEERP